jgi:hypothetical protein
MELDERSVFVRVRVLVLGLSLDEKWVISRLVGLGLEFLRPPL